MSMPENKMIFLNKDQIKALIEGTYSEETIAHFMRTSEVISSKTILGGITNPKKITLRCGLVGVWKPESKDGQYGSYMSEIAAYQLDKLLNLNMVPLTVRREINGEKGSLQLWVHNMSRSGRPLPDDAKFFKELTGQFDFCNLGIYSHNYSFIGNGRDRRVVLFDNAGAFPTFEKSRKLGGSLLQPTESVLEKAQQLDWGQLKDIQDLTGDQRLDLLTRRFSLMEQLTKNVRQSHED